MCGLQNYTVAYKDMSRYVSLALPGPTCRQASKLARSNRRSLRENGLVPGLACRFRYHLTVAVPYLAADIGRQYVICLADEETVLSPLTWL